MEGKKLKRICIAVSIISSLFLIGCGFGAETTTESTTDSNVQEIIDSPTPVSEEEEKEEEIETENEEEENNGVLTVDDIRSGTIEGEMDNIGIKLYSAKAAYQNKEVMAYKLTNNTNSDLLVWLEFACYDKSGNGISGGGGSMMYLTPGETGIDYEELIFDEESYFVEIAVGTGTPDTVIKENEANTYTEEYVEDGRVHYSLFFGADSVRFKYVIAYEDADGNIIACDSTEGGGAGDPWHDEFIAPDVVYEKFETSLNSWDY